MKEPDVEDAPLDESVVRFSILHNYLLEKEDVWYRMRAEENHLRFGSFVERKPKVKESPKERRYFRCFYDSFTARENRFYSGLLMAVLKNEYMERAMLSQYERGEFCGICRYAGDVLNVAEWRRSFLPSLSVSETEEVERRVIAGEFFEMLLEAVCTLEILSRRTIMFLNEPASRSVIEGRVVNDWVDSRRRQVERERMEEANEAVVEHQRSLAYHIWKRREARHLFLFEETEQDERLGIGRLQRLHFGVIFDLFHREHKEARYYQLKWERMQRSLPAKFSREIMTEETMQRSAIMFSQRDQFCTLQGEEVKSFLWTRRNIMTNEVVGRERGCDVRHNTPICM